MLKAIIADGQLTFESSVRGIAIYLDTFALKSLARGMVQFGDGLSRRLTVAQTCFFQPPMQ